MIDPALRALLLHPPIETSALAGIGGQIRLRDEDFVVDEIPAYEADGTTDRHLLVRLEKRGLTTDEAVRQICAQVGVSPREAGVAGKKDKHAVTRQWISLPAATASELARFDHEDIRLLAVEGHRHKLRRGHNHGNRFEVVVRELDVDLPTALARCHAKAEAITERRGILNYFGDQRFGHDGANFDRGLEGLRSGRRGPIFELSAGQSALFNLFLLRRQETDAVDRLLEGDLVQKTDTGGMFEVEDPRAEQPRADRGELVVTGPIFGSKTRRPAEGSPARRLEDRCLEEAEVAASTLGGFGKKLPGSRRALRTNPAPVEISVQENDELPAGIRLGFELPSGSYATRVLAEFQEGGDVRPKESDT